MGDSGALPMGFLLGALALGGAALQQNSHLSIAVFPVLVMLVPLLDTAIVTLSRLATGNPISRRGLDHSHHRLLMLGLTTLLAIFFVAYVLSLQGSVLMETRRHTKEMQVQRELADKAEASRFTELRHFLEIQHGQAHTALLARIDALEQRLAKRVDESDNATAAYVGQLEHQMRSREQARQVVTPLV